ncbi:hypothetical protein ACRC5O_001102 [Klebsiella pneumoniae]
MKVIKYWKVQLLRLSQPSSIIEGRKPFETLLFEGYSKDKPNIKLGTGQGVELFTAPDSLETKIIRDHFIDSVSYIPVYEDDADEKGGLEITILLEPQISKFLSIMGSAGSEKEPEKIHDYSCINFYLNRGPCLGDCHVTDVNKALSSSFEDIVKPVIKWLNENANPHASVIVGCTSAQLLTGEIGIHTEEFIKD